MIESLDQVGFLFLSDLSRQECSTYTTTSQQEFDVPESRTGHGRDRFSQTTNTRWRQVTRCVDMRSHCTPEYAGKLNNCSHLTECAEKPEDTSHTSQSTRMDQTKDLHSSKCTRNTDSHCSKCADTNLFSAEFTKRGRCEIPGSEHNTNGRLLNDANNVALFLAG